MRPPHPCLLVAFLLLPISAAGADDQPAVLRLGGATVVASPGVPSAMDAFLPGDPPRGPITWPLPDGPVIALGLPAQDPAAQGLADLLQLDVDDLDGGYRIYAWHDGHRPIVVVMAADPAALLAARFEFDAEAPAAMMDPNMRSLDFNQPNEQADIAVRCGSRAVRPRFLLRAWHSLDTVDVADAATAAGARANRVWIPTTRGAPAKFAASLADLRAHGVTPVVYTQSSGTLSDKTAPVIGRAIAQTLQQWQEAAGIRHFAVRFDAVASDLEREGADAPVHEHAVARQVADLLRPGGLEELTIVPRCDSDRLAEAVAPPPVLTDIPEAVIAWSGPSELSTVVPREAAARRVAQAGGTPVVLLEMWSAPFQGPGCRAYIPTLPRGRAEGLGEVLDGVVVLGRRGAEAPLASLWARVEGVRFGVSLLPGVVPTTRGDPASLLTATAAAARAAATENLGLVDWLAPWAEELEDAARDATERGGARVPLVPEPIYADGRLDERPWSFARPLVKDEDGVTVLALSDGHALRLGVRIDAKTVGDRPFVLHLQVGTRGRTNVWHVRLTPEGATMGVSDGGEHAVHLPQPRVTAAFRRNPRGTSAEITFDRFALGGEPHLGRVLDASITWGPRRLWPSVRGRGVLVVTR